MKSKTIENLAHLADREILADARNTNDDYYRGVVDGQTEMARALLTEVIDVTTARRAVLDILHDHVDRQVIGLLTTDILNKLGMK